MAKVNPRQQMKEGAKYLRALMLTHLEEISASIVNQLLRGYRNSTEQQRILVPKDIDPKGLKDYRTELIDALAALSTDALDLARKEVPKAKKVQLDDIDDLPGELKKKIKVRADSIIGKQVGDIKAELAFAYQMNQDILGGDDELEYFLNESAASWLNGTSVYAGAEVTASTVISEAREAFFFDNEVKEEIDAFEFVNGDPVSDICTDLAGTVFDKNDPNLFRYTPPLHWNCKSYIRPILKGDLGNRTIEKLKPSSKKIEETIQFMECPIHGHHKCLDGAAKQ